MLPTPFDEISDPFLKARRLFLPSTPMREASRLYGRHEPIERVRRELLSPGRSVFVFGDGGVGKTSLAQSVAFAEDTTGHDPALVRCYQADFSQLITKVARHLMGMRYYQDNVRKRVLELKLGGTAGHIPHRVETQPNDLVKIDPLYAVDILPPVGPAREDCGRGRRRDGPR